MRTFNPNVLRHCLKPARRCIDCPATATDICFSQHLQAEDTLVVLQSVAAVLKDFPNMDPVDYVERMKP